MSYGEQPVPLYPMPGGPAGPVPTGKLTLILEYPDGQEVRIEARHVIQAELSHVLREPPGPWSGEPHDTLVGLEDVLEKLVVEFVPLAESPASGLYTIITRGPWSRGVPVTKEDPDGGE